MSAPTPQQAWDHLVDGNKRFVTGTQAHPNQDIDRREKTLEAQRPIAALFGCSDSRLSAEIIFDVGLGDLFVVRNAGQVISDSVIGSLEYAVSVLEVPLIVVLGHDNCGAVNSAIARLAKDAAPLPAFIEALTLTIAPAIRRVAGAAGQFAPDGSINPDEVNALKVGREHLRDTVAQMLETSELISHAIADGKLAIVGANYRLDQGQVKAAIAIGNVSDENTK